MTINLPVAHRELRVAAHSVRIYRARAGAAAAGIVGVICAFLGFDEIGRRSPYLLGQAVFFVAAWTVFLIAAAGCGATADSVSSEKRAGTLGLLFLTHLKGRDIILGKLLAHSLRYFAGIVALFPILAAPVLLGGVGFAQCLRLFISVANMMFFSTAAGLLASTFCSREQVAQSKALQIVLFFTGVLPLLAAGLRRFAGDPPIGLAMDLASPLYAQRVALGGLVGPQFSWFCISTTFVFGISCAMLATASWLIRRSWQEGGRQSWAAASAQKMRNALGRTIPARSTFGRTLLDRNPFQWLAVRDPSLHRAAWLALATAVILVAALHPILSLYWPQAAFSLMVCPQLLFLLLALFKVRVGCLAVTHIAYAKENGSLEAIVASRVRFQEIIAAQFRALWSLLGWPLLSLIPLGLAALVYSLPGIDQLADMFTTPPEIDDYRRRAGLIVAIALVFLFLDSITLTWVGMLCAIKISRTGKARSWTGFLVLAVPNTVYLALIVYLLQFSSVRPLLEAFYPPVALWVFLKLANNILLIAYSRAWLLRDARRRVSAPLEQTRDQCFWPAGGVLKEMLRTKPAVLEVELSSK